MVIITGGSSGIGKQLACDLLRLGNKVIIASNDIGKLNQAIENLSKISPQVYKFWLDVGELQSVKNFADQVLQEHGCPDVLVNCAGFATYHTFEEMPIEEIERLLEVNLLGAIRCAHFFIPEMISRGNGSIVNVASIAGKIVLTPNSIYCASKHGMVAWSEALQCELSHFNINVSIICPGRVETPFFDEETFRTRSPRTETQFTVPVEYVSRKIIKAIEKKKDLIYIPYYYAFFIWIINSFRFIIYPLYKKLLIDRVNAIYKQRN